MKVVRARGVEGARNAGGHVVVIDVLRAFTTAAYAFHRGAREILLCGTVEEAFALRERWPDLMLVGEVGGKPIPGFDLGNSPDAVRRLDLTGRHLALRTSSGTQGVVHAGRADRILLGSLVVAGATLDHLRRTGAELVTVVAMGAPNGPDGQEDEACAELLEARLLGREPVIEEVVAKVRQSPAAALALDPAADWISEADLACAVDVDRFDFAMEVSMEETGPVARVSNLR